MDEPEPNYPRMCIGCKPGHIMSGPHTGETVPESSRLSHEYKGTKYSSRYCPKCRNAEAESFIGQARRRHARLLQHEREHGV